MKPEVLAKAFVVHKSEDAFCELVASTVDEVYTIALRVIQAPPHLVEEAVLRVYWELAHKAPRLSENVVLTTWLREQTCKTAVKVLHEADRSVDRASLKKERHGASTPNGLQAAPPGLATRVSQSILLNNARTKSLWLLLPRALWPIWIRPAHIRVGAVCALGVVVLWNLPLHRPNQIIQSPEVQMTPASFGQLASSDEGVSLPPPRQAPITNSASTIKQP